jgi:hypothetical protein
MGKHKMFDNKFTNDRRLAWVRSKAQAEFRGELWNLSWEEFCHFWSNEELWKRRGRHNEDLVLTRYDIDGVWDRTNCCIITRYDHLRSKIDRKLNRDVSEYFKDAIWYDR